MLEQARHRLHEGVPVQEEIVVVEDVLGTLAFHVSPEDGADRFDLLLAPGEVPSKDNRELLSGIHCPRVDCPQGVLAGEAPLPGAQAHVVSDQVEEIGRVGLVQHREVGGDPDGPTVQAKQPITERVEGAAPHLAADPSSDHPLGPGEHLSSGPARERQQQDPLGTNAPVDELGHAAREGEGLDAPRTGHHEEGTADVGDGGPLLRVQLVGPYGHGLPPRRPFPNGYCPE